MLNFSDFPVSLQYYDAEIGKMSIEQLAKEFEYARTMLLADDYKRWQQRMWSAIERVRTHPSSATMQKVVDHLEEYKRRLGRQYAAQHNMRILLRYNEVETDIQWLVSQYECIRSSKPYYLSPKY